MLIIFHTIHLLYQLPLIINNQFSILNISMFVFFFGRGLATQLVRQIPNTAIMMSTYEAVVYILTRHFNSEFYDATQNRKWALAKHNSNIVYETIPEQPTQELQILYGHNVRGLHGECVWGHINNKIILCKCTTSHVPINCLQTRLTICARCPSSLSYTKYIIYICVKYN